MCVAHLAPLYRTVRRGSILHKIYAHLLEKILLMVVRGTPNRTERDRFVTYSYPGKCYLFLLLKASRIGQQDNISWKKTRPWLCAAAVQFYKGALDKDFRQNAVLDYALGESKTAAMFNTRYTRTDKWILAQNLCIYEEVESGRYWCANNYCQITWTVLPNSLTNCSSPCLTGT